MKKTKFWSMMMLMAMMMPLTMGCSKDSDDGPSENRVHSGTDPIVSSNP